MIVFQSTHPRRVRLQKLMYHYCTIQFQSTHPRRVRQWQLSREGNYLSFNPRTHAGCDYYITNLKLWNYVSIHAPTQGATSATISHQRTPAVSIHAPTQGATVLSRYKKSGYYRFQSTHPRRVRLQLLWNQSTHIRVSIHAPTQGAT